jgi:Domain of unknown function (DUF4365)
MIRRSKAQKIGSQGHKWALSQIENHPHWLARDLGNEDFGVDAEAELNIDVIKGEILKLQFKTTEHLLRKDGRVKIDIEQKYIEFAESCRYPVILVRIDLSAKKAWYLWLQQWILEERTKGNKIPVNQGNFTTWVDETQTLGRGLEAELKAIARWEGQTQLALSLRDATRAAAATYNPKLVARIVDLLSEAAPIMAGIQFDAVLREAVLMRDRLRGTPEGNAIADQLFALVRKLGDQMTVETVDLMVRRDDTYSRTGLTGLGILYDEHFSHASSLGLTNHFLEKKLPGAAYYCALREAYPERETYSFLSGHFDFVFAGLECVPDDKFLDKFANRGPSAILDYLVPATKA